MTPERRSRPCITSMIPRDTTTQNSTGPAVSVIIPLYNHELYIAEAIQSVLRQTFGDFELLIVDDGSTDKSAEIVKDIRDSRLEYIYQDNKGAYAAINRGIELANGSYIAILNSDDAYHEQRLEKAIQKFNRDCDVTAVFSYVELIDRQGQQLRIKDGARGNWLGHDSASSFEQQNQDTLNLLAGNFLHSTSNLICKKEIFDEIGLFLPLRYVHDYEFFLRLCYRYKIALIEEPLLRYRFHEANTLTEDFAASNFETALVLAQFLADYDLESLFPDGDLGATLMMKAFNSLNTYNTDRVIMVLLLFWLKYAGRSASFSELVENPNNPFRKACLAYIEETRDASLLKESLEWQRGETTSWWRKTQETAEALARQKDETIACQDRTEELTRKEQWQKEQTDLWWSRCQETENALTWQKEQTDLWWSRCQETENALTWQKEQTDLWWSRCQETENVLTWQKEQTDLWWSRCQETENALTWQKKQTDIWWQQAQKAEQMLSLREGTIRYLSTQLDTYIALNRPIQTLFPAGTRRRLLLSKFLRRCLGSR
ncbi:glycosyltransferase, group 2 family protein [delta proteobacterium NaphS2]|nr:glycosyltransferase, group 2 family protein [delta proteobacterium NaphS2]